MRAYVPREALEQFRDEEDFLVWEENWPAVVVFVKSGSQWHTGFAGRTGLNLEGVKIVAETLEIPWTAQLLEDLQVMEGLQLKELARRAALKPTT